MNSASSLHLDEARHKDEFQTYRRELENTRRHLTEMSDLLSRVIENAMEGILITDEQNIIQMVNPVFDKTTGYTSIESIGSTPALIKSGHHDQRFYADMWNTLNLLGQWQGEIWNRNKDGEIFLEWLKITAIRDAQQKVSHYVGMFSDVRSQESDLDRLHYLANHDVLTGLPNRRLFLDRLNTFLFQARREKHMLAVMFVDLDRFKLVNDSLGHKIGDGLLVAVSERMKNCLREGDTLARLGGDEFTAILPTLDHPGSAINVAQKILDCCTSPIYIEGRELHITASIGIGIFPNDGEDADSLLHKADMAMYRIKEAGRNGYFLNTSGVNT
ncbi:MAG: diguanylate cyclase [Nitrosomonadales bacterium]|nr:diguanylate cyclase [Nitrosomonadales bacterium]